MTSRKVIWVQAVSGEATQLEGDVQERAKKAKSVISKNAYDKRQRLKPETVQSTSMLDDNNSNMVEQDEASIPKEAVKCNPETDLNTANNKRQKTEDI